MTKKTIQNGESNGKRKALALLGLLGVALVILTVFIYFSSTGRVVESQEPLRIGVIVYPGFAPFFIAEEKNFFEKQGVNAEVIVINDPTQAISVLASGQVDMLFSSSDFTPIIRDSGLDIKEILVSDIGYGSDGLVVKNDVNKISDLKGKKVYLSTGTPSHFLFRYLARQEGLSVNDVELVHMEADQVGAAFVAQQIDYGMTWEPWLSKATERGDGKVLVTSQTQPGIITDTFVVRTDVLENRREDVKAVVRAWFDSVEFIESNPAEANAIMAENLGLPEEDFVLYLETIQFLNYNENLEKFDKTKDLNLYYLTETAVQIYKEDGILQSDVNSEEVVDSSVLRELYK